jgi:hypothetical protein
MGDVRVTAKSEQENVFIYNEIGLSLNSLPGKYPIWVVKYLKWVLKNGNRVIVRR